MKIARRLTCTFGLIASLLPPAWGDEPPQSNAATEATRAANRAQLAVLPMADRQAFEDARRGLVEPLGDAVIKGADGHTVWTLKGYEFLQKADAPDTVHPGLWRHAQLNMINGLFKVTDRIWQLRGFDVSNMTIIEGDTGLIVIDPLIASEAAQAGMALYFKHRPHRPVVAVIYTHSHVDHFGGVRGVVSQQDVDTGKVSIWAPVGFMAEAIGENVIAGNAMARRAHYQFGQMVPFGERGQVDSGQGKGVAKGSVTLIAPTRLIEKPVEKHRIDGVDIVFELTPSAEAPSELIMYYPQFRVLNMAEIANQNFHNLLPMRGALVRDPLAWSKYLDSALQHYGATSDVIIMQHHWPVWGRERVQGFLAKQRNAYRYVHDQTLRLINYGYTGPEVADRVQLPQSLQSEWSVHSHYGSLKHNIKAIYQRYLGYYDGNPVNLDILPPAEGARKSIEYMGGAQAALAKAREDYARGEYRWVAQIGSQLVFADPANQEARKLAADALEQLGYQSESATARNAYLQGAMELRGGVPPGPGVVTASADAIRAMPLEMFFDYLGIRLNGPKAEGKSAVINWRFTDTKEDAVLRLQDSTLSATLGTQAHDADATLTLTRATLDAISLQQLSFPKAVESGAIAVKGNKAKLFEVLGLLDTFPRAFPIVEPRPAVTP
jgi:alkyl sulfatase BDS1-like metallo-beta-lactamase superfamily hydrolase